MRRGFSLLEIGILLVIFGGIAAMATILGGQWVASEEKNSTELNLRTIEEAMDAYRKLNGRLPCPADITMTDDDAEYGFEAWEAGDTLGVCQGEAGINAAAAGTGVAYGAVPVNTLEINEALMRDQWGNLIVYYVTERATQEGSFWDVPKHTNYIEMTDTSAGQITVQDGRGGDRTTTALYALVSHGPNEHGAYDRGGVQRPTTDASTEEVENVDSTPNPILVAMTLDEDFDDIVSFKDRRQLFNNVAIASGAPATPSGSCTIGTITGFAIEDTTGAASVLEPYGITTSGDHVYAMGRFGDLYAYDITDPTNMVFSGTYDFVFESESHDLKIVGNNAFAVATAHGTFLSADISDPTNPAPAGTASSGGRNDLAISGSHAFTISSSNRRVYAIDISDPTNPTVVDSFNDTTNLGSTRGIAVSGNHAFVTGRDNNRIMAYDISDPTNISLVSMFTSADLAGAMDIEITGSHAIITRGNTSSVASVNISDPTNMTIADTVTSSMLNGIATVEIIDGYAFHASFNRDSVVVTDVSDPTNLSVVDEIRDSTVLDRIRDVTVKDCHAYASTNQLDHIVSIRIDGCTCP